MTKKSIKLTALSLVGLLFASCSTTYDSYGRPVQSVDPAAATLGVAAAGLIGYSLSKNRYKDNYKKSHNKHYHHPRYGNRYDHRRYDRSRYGHRRYY